MCGGGAWNAKGAVAVLLYDAVDETDVARDRCAPEPELGVIMPGDEVVDACARPSAT